MNDNPQNEPRIVEKTNADCETGTSNSPDPHPDSIFIRIFLGSINMVVIGPYYMFFMGLFMPLLGVLFGGSAVEKLLSVLVALLPQFLPPMTSIELLNALHVHPSQFVGLVVLGLYVFTLNTHYDLPPGSYGALLIYLFCASVLLNEVRRSKKYFESNWKRPPVGTGLNRWFTSVGIIPSFTYINLMQTMHNQKTWGRYFQMADLLLIFLVSVVILPLLTKSRTALKYRQQLAQDPDFRPLQWNDTRSPNDLVALKETLTVV